MKESELVSVREKKAFLAGYRAGYQDGLAAAEAEDPKTPTLMEMPIEALGLPTRPRNCLRAHGCLRVQDVAALPAERIARMRNLGPKSADEIARSLLCHGIFHTEWEAFLL